jgi:signal peptidase I
VNQTGISQPTRPAWWRRLLRFAERSLAVFGLLVIVYTTCFHYSRMVSGSMEPTLWGENWKKGDQILSERVSYWFRRPQRWEIVLFRNSDGMFVMKRVVGLPGETVQMLRGGKLVINGQPIEPPQHLRFLKYLPYGNVIADQVVRCNDGYYVLGDDSRDSDDSRFHGALPSAEILGRPWIILGPAGRRGFVR